MLRVKVPEKARWRDWLLVVIGCLMALKTGQNVVRLYKAGERVKEAQQRLEAIKAENEQLKQKQVEVNSPEFVEKEAREKLGYGKEGEVIVILPQEEENPKSQVLNPKPEAANWKQWWDLYVRLQ